MNRRLCRVVLILGVACAAVAWCASPAAAAQRYLTVEGVVTDQRGVPMPDVWVHCVGTSRASAVADSTGFYHLEVPGATLEELQNAPLQLRIQPVSKGWRYKMSNGDAELGIEMRLARDAAQVSRLTVRSNDSLAVSSVVISAVLDANPCALIEASFSGSRGAARATTPAKLKVRDTVTLTGLALTDSTETDPDGAPATAPAPRTNPASAPTSAPSRTNPAAPVKSSSNAARPPAANPSPTPAPAVVNPPPGAPAVQPGPIAPPPAAQVLPPPADRDGRPRKWNAAGDKRERGKPRVVRPGRDVSDGGPADPNGAPPDVAPTPGVSVRETPLRPVTTKSDPSAPVVTQKPPTGTPVPNVWNSSVPPTSGGTPNTRPGTPQMCDCTIRGTVEVRSEQPLQSRTQVVVSVEDAPESTTSVELFMGSPRAFEIHTAPCGQHRLRVWTRSKQKFLLTSGDARINCVPGGVQQLQVILEPAKGWGASR